MLQFKSLNIDQDYPIAGGQFSYTFDPVKGGISYQGHLDVSLFLFNKSYPFAGITKVQDPSVLLSKNLKPGEVFDFGNLKVMIIGIQDNIAHAQVTLNGSVSGQGTALFNLSAEEIALIDLDLQVKVPIYGNVHIHAHV